MLKGLLVLFAVCLLSEGQAQVRHKDAKVIREQRFNAGDGRFGSAFAQEDGTLFKEESTADGERIGQYSYIDRDGKTVNVRYTAGKDGFRILEGDHVPKGADGLESAAYDPEISATYQKVAEEPVRKVSRTSQPIKNVIQHRANNENAFNPFINPADPTHTNFRFNKNAADYNFEQKTQPNRAVPTLSSRGRFSSIQNQRVPTKLQSVNPEARRRAVLQPQQNNELPLANSVPECADCEGVNPFVNPADFSHRQQPSQNTQQGFSQSIRVNQQGPQQQTQQQTFRVPSLPAPTPFQNVARTNPTGFQPREQFSTGISSQSQQNFKNTRPLLNQQSTQQYLQQQQNYANSNSIDQARGQNQINGQNTFQQQQQNFPYNQPSNQQQFTNVQNIPTNQISASQPPQSYNSEIIPAFLQ